MGDCDPQVICTMHVHLNQIERNKTKMKHARMKIMMQGCESMSHNARTCKATERRIQVRFKRNDIGSLYVIMNRNNC